MLTVAAIDTFLATLQANLAAAGIDDANDVGRFVGAVQKTLADADSFPDRRSEGR
jgi:hypothetical protein